MLSRPSKPGQTGSQAALVRTGDDMLVSVRDLTVAYRIGARKKMQAVAGVSLDVEAGSTVALIGESGSGKSSFAKSICGLGPRESGSIVLKGEEVFAARDLAATAGAKGIAMVFQDPVSALDPQWPVWRSITEPRVKRYPAPPSRHRERAQELALRVGLDASLVDRKPHQLSGGQRQRVTIARALAAEPSLVILDEAVSALDVSVRNEVLGLLDRLKTEDGLTYLLISHDMGAVVQIATKIAVLYLGKLVEVGEAAALVRSPVHPYTQALLNSVPTFDAQREIAVVEGETGDPANPPKGCRFHPRCPYRIDRCSLEEPEPRLFDRRTVACHRSEDISQANRAL